MKPHPKPTPSQEMLAANGPTEEIEHLQVDLAAVLAEVLQRRNSIKGNTGPEADEEVTRICASFTAANRRVISQRLLNAYCHNRYPIPQTVVPKDAPQSSKEIAEELNKQK